MKQTTFIFLFAFLLGGSLAKAQTTSARSTQNSSLINTWFEAPESSHGDTIVFKTTKHIKGANESAAFDHSVIVFKNTTDFSVQYWRACPAANWAYDGNWSMPTSGKIKLDFGAGKCKNDMQIISVTKNELQVILTESTN